MSDAVKAFVESVRSRAGANPAARVRVQSFTAEAGRAAGLALVSGWWVRVSEEGFEDDSKALLIGPFETVEESRVAVGAVMEFLHLTPVTLQGLPIKETNA